MSNSKSTDKLAVLVEALKHVPTEKLMKVKTFNLEWKSISTEEGDVILPTVKVEFFE